MRAAAIALLALTGCSREPAPDTMVSGVMLLARADELRNGPPEAQETFVAEVAKSRDPEALYYATRRMGSSDRWLIPLLVRAIDGQMGDFDGKLAAGLLWEHFLDDAPSVSDEKLAAANVSERTKFALAEQASRAGKLTAIGKQVLEKHMCAGLEPGRWGLLLTKMKPELASDLMDMQLNDVSYACDGSPGARSGLMPGDTILFIDGERVRGDQVLARFREKDRATVRVRRSGVERDIVVAK